MKYKYSLLAILAVFCTVFLGLMPLTKVHAATDQISMDLNWDGNCSDAPTITANPSYLYFWSGDTVSLTLDNQSSQVLDYSVGGAGGPLSADTSSSTITKILSDTLAIQVNPDYTTSCGYKSTPAISYIYGASTISALNCTISDNKVWNISANYDNVAPTDDIYRGSTPDGDFSTTKGGVGSGDFNTTFQYSAEATAQTYYLYDGTSSSDILLGQTTCPAATPSSPAKTKTTPVATASATSSTGSTTTTPVTTSKTTPTVTPLTTKTGTSGQIESNLYATNTSAKLPTSIIASYFIVAGLIAIVTLAGVWKTFKKAGHPGWAAVIPVYGNWVLFKLGGKPGWWSLVMLVPIVNIVALVVYVIAVLEIAKRFSKGVLFAVFGLLIFSFVGWPMLGLGKSTYKSGNGAATETTEPKTNDSTED